MTRDRNRRPPTFLLVGEAPSRTTDHPFAGRSGRRLEKLLGLPPKTLARDPSWCCVNLVSYWPGYEGKGSRYPAGAARRGAEELSRILEALSRIARPRTVLLAGRRVASAFGERRRTYLERFELAVGLPECYVIPHPSGVNRWWNEPRNLEEFERFAARLRRRSRRTAYRRCARCGASNPAG